MTDYEILDAEMGGRADREVRADIRNALQEGYPPDVILCRFERLIAYVAIHDGWSQWADGSWSHGLKWINGPVARVFQAGVSA